ncbi:MAG: ABC transporter substrate-binding protein [Trueperaceae bacterium]
MHNWRTWTASVLAALLLAGAAHAQEDQLQIATVGEPPGLDAMMPFGILTQHIGKHMFENLFTFNANWEPIPHLVSDFEVSDDGRVYTFNLREGVPFHDGSMLDSEDVVASLERWMTVETTASSNVEPVLVSLEATDELTVRLELSEPVAPLITMLAADGSPIYPSEIIEEYGEDPIQDYIGTGPYQFVEWLPDRHIELTRFEDYATREDEPSGFAGRREAIFETLRFIPVPDVSVRAAGVQAGQYDVALDLNPDMHAQFANDASVDPVLISPFGWPFFALNKSQGLFTDKCLRQALQASLDMDVMMAGGFGDPELYDVNGSIYPPEIAAWFGEAGLEAYNQGDPERAAQMLEECDYDGSPLRILTSRQYDFLYKISLIAAQQAEEAGFNVDLQVVEWATLVERRQQPEMYDFFVTFNSMSPSPPLYQLWLFEFWPGWWADEEKDALLAEFNEAVGHDAQFAVWERIQEMIYEEVAIIKIGDFYGLALASPDLEGLQARYTMPFWNVSRE